MIYFTILFPVVQAYILSLISYSGEEMGLPLLNVSLGFNRAGSQSKPWNNAKQHVIDIECEDTDDIFVVDTSLLNEVAL